MEEIVNLIMNNGLGIGCVCYLMYFQNTILKDIINSLNNININLTTMNERLSNLEEKSDKK